MNKQPNKEEPITFANVKTVEDFRVVSDRHRHESKRYEQEKREEEKVLAKAERIATIKSLPKKLFYFSLTVYFILAWISTILFLEEKYSANSFIYWFAFFTPLIGLMYTLEYINKLKSEIEYLKNQKHRQ